MSDENGTEDIRGNGGEEIQPSASTARTASSGTSRLMNVPGADIEIAYVRAPGHSLELIEYRAPASKSKVEARSCDTGAFHVAFDVDNLEAALASQGAGWKNIVQFTTYLVHSQDIPKFMKYRLREFPKKFSNGIYPPNTLLMVDRLVKEEFLIEVQATAAI